MTEKVCEVCNCKIGKGEEKKLSIQSMAWLILQMKSKRLSQKL